MGWRKVEASDKEMNKQIRDRIFQFSKRSIFNVFLPIEICDIKVLAFSPFF